MQALLDAVYFYLVDSKKGRGLSSATLNHSSKCCDLNVYRNDFLGIVVTAREANVVRALKLAAVRTLCVVAEGDCIV